MSSIFTRIYQGEIPGCIVTENNEFFVLMDKFPIKPGHCLIIPKQEQDYLFDMDKDAYTRLMQYSYDIADAVKNATGCVRAGVMVEGFGVPHVHVHLIPLNEIGDLNPENAKEADDKDLETMKKQIQAYIN